jgi:hypothetical protein
MTDAVHDAIHHYFHREHMAAVLLFLFAVASLGGAGWLWKKKHRLRMAALPLLLFGTLELGVSVYVALDSAQRPHGVEDAIEKDAARGLSEELDRVVLIKRQFKWLMRAELGLLAFSILIGGLLRKNTTWAAICFATAGHMVFVYGFDHVARTRADAYAAVLGDAYAKLYLQEIQGEGP